MLYCLKKRRISNTKAGITLRRPLDEENKGFQQVPCVLLQDI